MWRRGRNTDIRLCRPYGLSSSGDRVNDAAADNRSLKEISFHKTETNSVPGHQNSGNPSLDFRAFRQRRKSPDRFVAFTDVKIPIRLEIGELVYAGARLRPPPGLTLAWEPPWVTPIQSKSMPLSYLRVCGSVFLRAIPRAVVPFFGHRRLLIMKFPFSHFPARQKDCKNDEAGGKSLCRSQRTRPA